MRPGRHFLQFYLLILVLSATRMASADPAEWLMKINKAASEVNFAGAFVYIHDGKIEAMEVARRIKDGMMQERLYSLNGSPREVIRGMDQVWCFIPDANVVVHDHRQMSESGFPRILPSDFDQLQQNYDFTEGSYMRIANRMAHQINVVPKDAYRYGYSLWADMETGLLLRSDLVNQDDEIVEQYLFITIEIGGEISDEHLQPVSDMIVLELFSNTMPKSDSVVATSWRVRDVPSGYSLSKHFKRMSPMESGEVEHMVFTDGLSTVSVFIKEAHEGQSEISGISRMGAVHAFRKTVQNYRVTVMGEVPAETVEMLAQAVEHKN